LASLGFVAVQANFLDIERILQAATSNTTVQAPPALAACTRNTTSETCTVAQTCCGTITKAGSNASTTV
jgi:hypothetical protein